MIIVGTKLEPILVDGKECTKVTFLGLTDPKGLVPSVNLKAVVMKSMLSSLPFPPSPSSPNLLTVECRCNADVLHARLSSQTEWYFCMKLERYFYINEKDD